jgi:hypothetical protein
MKVTMILYRPVGLKELELVIHSGYRRFPPRLPGQPIFYPVLNFDYASQIAHDWNTKDAASDYAGFVLQFEVDDDYAGRFEIQTVGGAIHQELWVPAEELDEFNSHILGEIIVQASFYGPKFQKEKRRE